MRAATAAIVNPVAAQHDIDSLYRQAAAATAAGSKSFYFATRFFPPLLARQAHAVYWFCRTTDDLVDEAPSRALGEQQLNAWESELRQGWAGGLVRNPILALFLAVCRECGIPENYPFELIAGCRMDLEQRRYNTFDDLRLFCYRVASTVGLMMCHVIGFVPGVESAVAKQHAIDLGIAMQLTNILRDVGTDWALGRVYFPQADLERFGVTEKDLAGAAAGAEFARDRFVALMGFEMERARGYYAAAQPGVEMLRPEGRFAVEIAARVYERILGQIERNEFDVFARRAVVPAVEKYWITARAISAAWWERQRTR